MNKKKIVIKVLVALVVVSVSFYGGMKYAQSTALVGRGAFGGGAGGAGAKFRGSANGGGATQGTVLSKDATGITISLRNGGSQIVLVGSNTQFVKSVPGTTDDVAVGSNVMIIGTANSDGSFTASSVQLRPASATGN